MGGLRGTYRVSVNGNLMNWVEWRRSSNTSHYVPLHILNVSETCNCRPARRYQIPSSYSFVRSHAISCAPVVAMECVWSWRNPLPKKSGGLGRTKMREIPIVTAPLSFIASSVICTLNRLSLVFPNRHPNAVITLFDIC